jgi:DNA-binding GntR family transcriptional regulator
VIRLAEEEKLSQRRIAERLGLSKTTVNEILKRYRAEHRVGITEEAAS